MPAERLPDEIAIHASAVAIGGRALLIRGPSRSGKSRLAVALVSASTRARPIVLLGDDRILLHWRAASLLARPHPRVAGFIERRGLGIVAMRFAAVAPVAGIVDLGPSDIYDQLGENFPRLRIVHFPRTDAACRQVLDWWERDLRVTPVPESGAGAGAARKKLELVTSPADI